MNIIFLGTGTSQGVPVIACKCDVCKSLDFRDKRLRSSIYLNIDGKGFIFDTGPDFRTQVLRESINEIRAVIFTHEHKDHTAGLDDIRGFNFAQNQDIPIYGRERVLNQLKQEFSYAFAEKKYPGTPQIILNEISNTPFSIDQVLFTPIEVLHAKLPVFGFRVADFAYVTDANYISEGEMEKLKNLDVLVLNALQRQKHISHFNLEEALDIISILKPKMTYLTHISHKLGNHAIIENELPENVKLAFDGLKLKL